MTDRPEIPVSKRFFRAANWAAEQHAARSITAVAPSVAQVLGLASLVLDDGGSERDAIAAMLHDATRGSAVDRAELQEQFGKKVAAIVDGATIDATHDAYVDALDREPEISIVRIHAAERMRETQTLLREMRRHGSVSFARFDANPTDQLAFYGSLVAVFRRRLPRSNLVHELRTAVAALVADLDLDTATAAWRVAHAA